MLRTTQSLSAATEVNLRNPLHVGGREDEVPLFCLGLGWGYLYPVLDKGTWAGPVTGQGGNPFLRKYMGPETREGTWDKRPWVAPSLPNRHTRVKI